MPKFESKYRGLVLQDDAGIWAKFEGGTFETSDTKVADRLRKVEYVTEVDPPKPEPKRPAHKD